MLTLVRKTTIQGTLPELLEKAQTGDNIRLANISPLEYWELTPLGIFISRPTNNANDELCRIDADGSRTTTSVFLERVADDWEVTGDSVAVMRSKVPTQVQRYAKEGTLLATIGMPANICCLRTHGHFLFAEATEDGSLFFIEGNRVTRVNEDNWRLQEWNNSGTLCVQVTEQNEFICFDALGNRTSRGCHEHEHGEFFVGENVIYFRHEDDIFVLTEDADALKLSLPDGFTPDVLEASARGLFVSNSDECGIVLIDINREPYLAVDIDSDAHWSPHPHGILYEQDNVLWLHVIKD